MDEIVFEYRNKNYGAYILRKLYNKHVTISLLLAVFILCAGLAYPFISGLNPKNNGRNVEIDGGAVFTPPPPIDKVKPPPPVPPELDPKRLVLLPPKVVEGNVPDIDILNQDDLGKKTINAPVSPDEPGTTTDEPPVIVEKPDTEIHIVVQEMPSFTGGESALYQFLADNLIYPKMAKENNVQGKVYVYFVVDSRGHITNVRLLRGIGSGCDEEAIRVISMMPVWNAGKQDGRAVNVSFNMPIVFKLEN